MKLRNTIRFAPIPLDRPSDRNVPVATLVEYMAKPGLGGNDEHLHPSEFNSEVNNALYR